MKWGPGTAAQYAALPDLPQEPVLQYLTPPDWLTSTVSPHMLLLLTNLIDIYVNHWMLECAHCQYTLALFFCMKEVVHSHLARHINNVEIGFGFWPRIQCHQQAESRLCSTEIGEVTLMEHVPGSSRSDISFDYLT